MDVRINIVKMSKAIYRFSANPKASANPTKILKAFFTELEQMILKFVWNH